MWVYDCGVMALPRLPLRPPCVAASFYGLSPAGCCCSTIACRVWSLFFAEWLDSWSLRPGLVPYKEDFDFWLDALRSFFAVGPLFPAWAVQRFLPGPLGPALDGCLRRLSGGTRSVRSLLSPLSFSLVFHPVGLAFSSLRSSSSDTLSVTESPGSPNGPPAAPSEASFPYSEEPSSLSSISLVSELGYSAFHVFWQVFDFFSVFSICIVMISLC